ncbi:MAG: class I tRNA ligase family protein [Candidatus Kerfeldbacteria bacterium]|nr:class I tRNA ligase family protein [Candidatus Kerfeldbacteria bacterium]
MGKETGKKAYYIAAADFVTTEDGTGVVHTAVMYGEDDFQLGSKLGLPKKHTVDLEGKFTELVKPWAGLEVRDTKGETQHQIIVWLKEHGKLYKEEKYEHDYPFCWRCKHPLLYYAKTSWFITMSKLRDELIANNAKINWVPNHIKDGRFGEWLREVKDWAISRERYWGTPLPIWRCDSCKHQECLGGYEELTEKVPARNRFIFVRHGEATNSSPMVVNTDPQHNHVELTAAGRKQAETIAKKLSTEKIEAVYTSEFLRTQQTAEPLAAALGLKPKVDARLNENRIGAEWEGKLWNDYHASVKGKNRFHLNVQDGASENWSDVRTRVMSLLLELDAKHVGKTFVLVSHGDPVWVGSWALSLKAESQIDEVKFPELGEIREVKLPTGLHRTDGSFDPHRPYIDQVTYPCTECNTGKMQRVPEVADTWYDSGSMPLAQWHYPFENKDKVDSGEAYPAAFISEAIDQTRGWFYTLLAVSTILQSAKKLKAGPPYETCVVLGHIRDKNGKKLSKSAGNYIDPMGLIDKYGADAVRLYLYTVNQPSEPKNFDETQLADVVKKTFIILWNVVSFWKLHANGPAAKRPASRDIMDRWILAKLDGLTRDVTRELEAYDVVNAARSLTGFVTELSTWYVRRSRERAKGAGKSELAATLGYVLAELSKLMAPFTPFVADALWRDIGGEGSVHLQSWPTPAALDEQLLKDMDDVRQAVETGHALRAQAKLKVRQPLAQVVLTKEFRPDLDQILLDELNVKEVQTAAVLPTGVDWVSLNGLALDITLTDELREEGYLREMIRAVNATRKELKLQPGERVDLTYSTDSDAAKKLVEHFSAKLCDSGSLSSLKYSASSHPPAQAARLDNMLVTFGRA